MSTGTFTMVKLQHPEKICDNAEDAIKRIYDKNVDIGQGNVIVYALQDRKLANIVNAILLEIKNRNESIEDINKQILPTTYFWRDIDGCLGIICCEINSGEFSEMGTGLHPFAHQIHYDCLTDPHARLPLNPKCLDFFALLGSTIDIGFKEEK